MPRITAHASESVYQWSVPVIPPTIPNNRQPARAYLWIPPDCKAVRAVVIGQHNMLEEDIFDHTDFRKAMAEMNMAIIWITPLMDGPFNPEQSGPRFDAMLKLLADVSGYSEIAYAPIIPLGHSACATYPWNVAAWAPNRTLCVLSIHGDAPETPLAGFGRQSIHWADGAIDGVPGLMDMGEYEWIDARLAPATVYHCAHPNAPIAVLAEPGESHFFASDDLIHFLTRFVRKSAELRLPASKDTLYTAPPTLTPVDPAKGWLVQRWTLRHGRSVPPGPIGQFAGDSVDAFWAADEEMANAIQSYHDDQIGKQPQLIGFVQDGAVVTPKPTLEMMALKFEPEADGETFKVSARFLDTVSTMGEGRDVPSKNNHMRWTGLAAGAPLSHASGGGPIVFHRTDGPIEQVGADTFRVSFYRGGGLDRLSGWIVATHPGDAKYKRIEQQALVRLPNNTAGADQTIIFPTIADQKAGVDKIELNATSSAGVPVRYFVREGPAVVEDDTLRFLPIPPRAKYPVKVTVVAWQFGRATEPKLKAAAPVIQEFSINQ